MSREPMAQLRRHPVWSHAADRTLAALAAASVTLERAPGQIFVIEGAPADRVCLLVSGAARVFYPLRRERAEATVKLLVAPACFGDLACVARTSYTASVEAIAPSCALAIEARAYFAALQHDARACFRQYWDVAQRFARATQLERAALFAGVVERLVALLLAWAEYGDGEVRLSQDDLAQQVGSTRRSVVRAMELLYKSGGLERRGRRYAVVDREKLLAAASGDVPNLVGTADAAPWAERG